MNLEGNLKFSDIENAGFNSINSLPATTHGFNGSILADNLPVIFYKPSGGEGDNVDILAGGAEDWRIYRLPAKEMRSRARENKPIDIEKREPLYSGKPVIAIVLAS